MLFKGSVYSEVLEMSCEVTVVGPKILPTGRPLKAVYLLHGHTGSCDNWLQYSLLPLLAREGHTLFVLPTAGRSWYTDMRYGRKYFTYIAQELPRWCAKMFNISTRREDTAVMGNSMGGYGALKCALRYPEQYGLCCAFSPAALYWKDYLATPNCASLADEFTAIFGPEYTVPDADEILWLAHSVSQNAAVKPVIRAFCGRQDFLIEMNRRFDTDMKTLDFDYAYEEWDGEHDWTFWNECLRRAFAAFNF